MTTIAITRMRPRPCSDCSNACAAPWNVVEIVDGTVAGGGAVQYKRYTGRPLQNFARVIEFQSTARSKYDGVTFDLNKRFSRNWQARLAYTYSTVKDDRPDATAIVPFTFHAKLPLTNCCVRCSPAFPIASASAARRAEAIAQERVSWQESATTRQR